MRAFLVDDEPLARDELNFLLGQCTGLSIVGEAENARDALMWLESNVADIVFVDLHMPGPDGLSLCSRLQELAHKPHVVIVSAHEESAARAFEAGASDYLLKPVRLARLAQCIDKLRSSGGGAQLEASTRVALKSASGYKVVNLEDALFFEIRSDGLVMTLPSASYTLDLTLSDVEQRLATHGGFFRCHRSALVRIDAVTAYEPYGTGAAKLKIGEAHELPVARERMRELRQLIPVAG